jgi:phage recombination protein Bet
MSNQLMSLTSSLATSLGYSVEPAELMANLKATVFKGGNQAISDAHMMQLLLISNQYGLNPWTKEIYAFPSNGGIQPIVGVDGWTKIINSHPQLDGVEFDFGGEFKQGGDGFVTCIIHRKDRSYPIKVTEYLAECMGSSAPWRSFPRRMLRHKALIQAARLAFGFSGIVDPDEYERGEYNADPKDVTPAAKSNEFKVPTKVKKTEEVAQKPTVIDAEVVDTQDDLNKAINAVNNKLIALGYTFAEFVSEYGLPYSDIDDLSVAELRQFYKSLATAQPKRD